MAASGRADDAQHALAVLAVAVPSPLRTLFDYLPPAGATVPAPGVRVRVPFGRGHKVGLVVARRAQSSVARERLRRIAAVLDAEPLLDADSLRLMRFTMDYFHHPPGDVLSTMLPPWLRQGRPLPGDRSEQWVLTHGGHEALDTSSPRLGALQRRLLQAVRHAPLDAAQVRGREAGAIRRLAARGLVARREVAATQPAGHGPRIAPPVLNAEQDVVVREVETALGRYAGFLLEGVTGSGKTEVYIALIERVLARGGQALVLIPEIGLTPQIVDRFQQRLGVAVAPLHSGLADGERLAAWQSARTGRAPVVVGTRSAVFTPLPRLGLVVVDEEHDPSYKQQDGLRYSARDLAVLRARQAGVPVLLGSASPSLESLHNVRGGRYAALHLRRRAGAARSPSVQVVDLRGRAVAGGMCEPMRSALAACLDAGEQAILFVNRRGFAPVLLCHECGATLDCPRCDAHLVLHRAEERLRCHHCARVQPIPDACACGAPASLQPVGTGTQRVTDFLARHFPAARVARVDRDSTRRRGAMHALLEQVRAGELDVLVGTQMLAKGHDFPNVTLVGILDADAGLFSADFRASERMAQLLTQVAGRAGRGEREGKVLIQTHHPQHALLHTLVTGGYRAFGEAALAERARSGLPPYSHLALLRAEAHAREAAHEFLAAARRAAPPGLGGVSVLGPVPAPMERRAGRVRAQLLVESEERAPLHRFLAAWLDSIEALPGARRVRWSLDVDPQETL